ncbi:MAG TPA: hypothetical protein VMM58_03990 [Bacteroidota bacterium]|nr:hypothetical protein [Bacteroidota bacterium]
MNQQISRIIFILLFGSAAIGLPIWDKLSPMQDFDRVIESHYGNQFAWCVGLNYSFRNHSTTAMRAYILMPNCFSHLSATLVTKVNDDEPSVSDSIPVLLGALFVYANLAWVIWKSFNRSEEPSQQGPNPEIGNQ